MSTKRGQHFLVVCVVVTVLLIMAPRMASSDARPPVKIGILTDLSGKAAYMGVQTRMAAEILSQELNQGGKTRVEFVFSDHALDPARAVSEAQKLLNVDKVDALFSNFSGTSRAANPVAKNAKKLFMYTAAAVEPANTNPFAFKSYLDYVATCKRLAERWKQEGVIKVGVMKAEAEFGELCLEGIRGVYPNADVASYKLGEEVKTQVLTFKSKGVEAIANAGLEGDMENMLKAIRELKFNVRIGANEDIFTEKLIKNFAPELAQATAFGMPPVPQELLQRLKAVDSKNADTSLSQAGFLYLHLKQLEAALEACASGDLSCQSKKILESSADKAFGFIKWREDRQAEFDWVVTKFIDGKFVAIH